MTMTNEELLEKWDRGEPIRTASMGGMGEHYEQSIHLIAMELLREFIKKPFDYAGFEEAEDDEFYKAMMSYLEPIFKLENINNLINDVGPTDAMMSAARNLAHVFANEGYEKALTKLPEERLIPVSYTHLTLPTIYSV